MSVVWILWAVSLGLVGFAFLIALQARWLGAFALRAALQAHNTELDSAQLKAAVAWSISKKPLPSEARSWLESSVKFLNDTYPSETGQLHFARRVCAVTPLIALGFIAVERLGALQ